MHDLRAAVYRHLQRLSLAFFTRTRTGEVQSRISNDIGGVEDVLTSTATSVASNPTTVIATVVAMFLLDWRLAAFSLALLPLFVWLTRRVGEPRRKISATRQESMAAISSLVQESLSVSGILLGKTMGRSAELAGRFEAESQRLADLEVRARMTGRWMMASIQTTFTVMPALVYWFGGLAVARGSARDHARHARRLHDPAGAPFFPIGSLLGVSVDVQSSLALFDRVFEYLDQTSTSRRADARAAAPARRRRRARRRLVPLRPGGLDARRGSRSTSAGHDDGASSARRARGRRPSATSSPGSTTPPRRRCDRRGRCPRPHLRRARRRRRGRLPGDVPLPCDRAREPPLRQARR